MGTDAQDALKDYALALYGRDGVSAACLLLQERTGLDVNILLFAAWMGATRGRALGAEDAARAREAVGEWHKEIVRPLRAVRRRLKTGPLPAPSEATAMLRVRLQALEISAEIIELEELGALGLRLGSQSGTGARQDMAALGMLAVVEAAAGRAPETEEKDAVETIARAAAETAL